MIKNFNFVVEKSPEEKQHLKNKKIQNFVIIFVYVALALSALAITGGLLQELDEVYLILMFEFFMLVAIFAIINIKLSNRLIDKKGERFKVVNEKVKLELAGYDFSITKVFPFSAKYSGETDIEKMLVFVDGKNQKFAFVDYNKKSCSIVDFKDLVSYKIIENNGSEIESSTGYSLFFDSLYTKVSSVDVCKNLKLVFVLNDEENATVVYELNKTSLSIKDKRYKNLSQELIDLTAFIDIVQNKIPKDKKFIYCRHCGVKNAYDQTHCSACGSVLN